MDVARGPLESGWHLIEAELTAAQDMPVAENIQPIFDEAESAFCTAYQQLAHTFYQRGAQPGELDSMQTKTRSLQVDLENRVCQVRKNYLGLPSAQDKRQTLASIMYVEILSPALLVRSKQLCNALSATSEEELEQKGITLKFCPPRRQANDLTELFKQAAAGIELPKQCTSLLGQRWLVGYPAINDINAELTSHATCLFFLEEQLKYKLKQACNGDVEQFDTFLQSAQTHAEDLEDAIAQTFNKLVEKELSNQIFVGWSYALWLHAEAKVLACTIQHFKDISLGALYSHKRAQIVLTHHFESRTLFTLFDAITLVCSNPELKAIHEKTLAEEASSLAALTDAEERVPQNIMSSSSDWPVAESYLMKGFMRYLYSPSKAVDFWFEATLFASENDPAYKNLFHRTYSTNTLFRTMCDSYKAERLLESSHEACMHLHGALKALYKEPPANLHAEALRASRFVRYHLAKKREQALIARIFLPNQEERIIWLHALLQSFAKSWQEALDDTKEAAIPLHQDLMQSLFSCDSEAQEEANAKLERAIKVPDCLAKLRPGITSVLFMRWALTHIADNEAGDIPFLQHLFHNYIHNVQEKALCWSQFDVGFMENALRKKQKSAPTPNSTRKVWYDVLCHYSQFRSLIKKEGIPLPGTDQFKRAEELHAKATSSLSSIAPNDDDYYQIAQTLTREMEQILQRKTLTYCQQSGLP